jgi:predicted cation transporter
VGFSLGSPLATIVIAALAADFWYLIRLIRPLVVAGILIVSALPLSYRPFREHPFAPRTPEELWRDIAMRAARVYAFVAGLVGLFVGTKALRNEMLAEIRSVRTEIEATLTAGQQCGSTP